MGHGPGCFIASNIQKSLQVPDRLSGFTACNEKYHPEPFLERLSAFMENSAGRNRYLIFAVFTLIKFPSRYE
jgi:hypothetical protein